MKIRTAFALAFARVMNKRNMSKIEEAGADERRVEISYVRKRDGAHIVREVRPYEIKPHRTSGTVMLYATDEEGGAGQIKSFIANRVVRVSKPKGHFRPKWDVQFGNDEEENGEETDE